MSTLLRGIPLRHGGKRAVLACSLAAAVPACEPELCGQICGSDGSCPGGFICAADALHCVPLAHPNACGAFASSSSEPAAGESAPTAPASAFEIEGTASPDQRCQGDAFSASFHVPAAPGHDYTWRLLQAPPGLVLSSDQGADVQVSGETDQPGRFAWQIEVQDGDAVARLPLSLLVHERPRIQTSALPSVCPGEIYRATLRAEGGSGRYAWSTSLAEATGLRVDAQELGGLYSGSEPAGALSVELSARDEFCEAKARATLDVLVPGSEHCPVVEASEGESAERLPPPCLGNDYEVHLGVRQANAGADYQWQALQAPPGLHFDPGTLSLSGRALGAGDLVLRVTDAESRQIEARFSLTPRTQCWFGYVAGPMGARRVQLLDARLSYLASAHRVSPPDTQAGDVLDLAFSPGGRFVAYRLQQPDTAQLWLLDLHTWREQPIALAGSVTHYAWGPSTGADASWLAVSWSSAGTEQLGAVKLGTAPDDPLDVSASELSGATSFSSPSLPLLSAPLWLNASESTHLLQYPDDPRQWMLQFVRYGDAGPEFLAPHDELTFTDQARLQRGAAGVFVIDEPSSFHNYFPSDGAPFTAHSLSTIIAPSGRFVARSLAERLQVFRAGDASWSDDATPWAAADGCSALLAWAEGRERIACARASDGKQQVVFYELPDPAQPQLVELPRVQGDYSYATGEQTGRPRAFSPQGDRFAFTAAAGAYVVKLDDGTPRIERVLDSGYLQADVGALSFSPDGQLLSLHAGANLFVWSMKLGADYWARLPQQVEPPAVCSENFANPDQSWCGLPPRQPPVSWSEAGDLFAYRSAAGNLELEDVSLDFAEHRSEIQADLSCDAQCSRSGYAFQP